MNLKSRSRVLWKPNQSKPAFPGAAVIAMDLNRIQGRGHHGVVALGKDTASSFQRLCESHSLLGWTSSWFCPPKPSPQAG